MHAVTSDDTAQVEVVYSSGVRVTFSICTVSAGSKTTTIRLRGANGSVVADAVDAMQSVSIVGHRRVEGERGYSNEDLSVPMGVELTEVCARVTRVYFAWLASRATPRWPCLGSPKGVFLFFGIYPFSLRGRTVLVHRLGAFRRCGTRARWRWHGQLQPPLPQPTPMAAPIRWHRLPVSRTVFRRKSSSIARARLVSARPERRPRV